MIRNKFYPNKSKCLMAFLKSVFYVFMIFSSVIVSMSEAKGQEKSAVIEEKELIGSWELDYEKWRNDLEQGKMERLNKKGAELNAKVKELYKNRTYIFNDDGSFELFISSGQSLRGTWVLSQRGKSIELLYPSGNKDSLKLISKNGLRLRLKSEGQNADKLLLSELYLIKK